MDYGKIHRYDSLNPSHPGKYLVKLGYIKNNWIPVLFDGSGWTFLNGDEFRGDMIILWRVLYCE